MTVELGKGEREKTFRDPRARFLDFSIGILMKGSIEKLGDINKDKSLMLGNLLVT